MGKKQIAVITPGILPIPCSKGGAVETLIDAYLQENEKKGLFHFHVYTIYDSQANELSTSYKYASFHFFNPHKLFIRISRLIFRKKSSQFYYNPYMDYYGHWAIQQIQKRSIDLLIIENRQGFILNNALKVKIPTILHLHNDTLNNKAKAAESILGRYNKIITVSKYIKKQVDSIAPNPKTTVVYNGIHIKKFISPNFYYERKTFQLRESDFVVIYSGRISPIKGIRELIQSFIPLQAYPDIKLLIVGSSIFFEKEEDKFSKEIKNLAEQIKGQVKFTGYIPYENIPSILPIADIGIVPSVCEEAFSLSALECMAAGLPIIATRSGGIPEVVDENCAILVEKDDSLIEQLTKSIIKLYKDPKNRLKMAQNGKIRCHMFDQTVYISNFMIEINKTLADFSI